MEHEQTPVGRVVVMLFGLLGALTLKDWNLLVSTAAGLVSLIVGLLTAALMIRRLRKREKRR